MATATAAPKSDLRYYIHSVIAIAIMVFARFIPVSYPFTQDGMLVLGVLIGAIYAYVNGNPYWGSIVALLIIGMSEVTTVGAIFVSLMSNGNLMFLTVLFVFVGYLGSVGFARTLALKIVQSKMTKGRPWVLTLFLFIAAVTPASFMSVSAVFVLTLPILYAICDEVGMERDSKWAVMTAIGIGCACGFALVFWPFQVGPVAMYGQLAALGYGGGAYVFLQHVLFMLIIVGLCIGAMVMVIKFLKPDISKLYNYSPPEEKAKFNEEQRFAVGLVCLLLALFIVPQFLPRGSAIQVFMAQFGMFAIVSFVLTVGVFVRKNGKPRLDMVEATRGLQMWPLIIMIGSVLVIADILTRPELGFIDFVTLHLGPILGVNSPVVFTIIVMIIALIITTFVQGTLVVAIMLPLMLPIATAMGFSIMAVIMPFLFIANIGLIFPSSHPLGAIMHGHESIGPKATIKYVGLYMAVFAVIVLVVGIPLGLLIF